MMNSKWNMDARPFSMLLQGSVSRLIADLPGDPLIVGGSVRDTVLDPSIHHKDIDIELYHVPVDDTIRALGARRYHVDIVGRRFGVLRIQLTDTSVDLSFPRTENIVGSGHRGFNVVIDPTLAPVDAASRRDFTFNSMMFDPREQVLLDPYHGERDLENGIMRAVGEHYGEDPLRVLRGFQFAGRFDMRMTPDTVVRSRGLLRDAHTLSAERVHMEWDKFFTRGRYVQAALRVLRDTGWDSLFAGLHGFISDDDSVRMLAERWDDASPVIRMAALAHYVGADSGFLNRIISSHAERGVVRRLMAVSSTDIDTTLKRREWEYRHRDGGVLLPLVHEYALAVNDGDLADMSALDNGYVKPLVSGDMVMAAHPGRRPGAWIQDALNRARLEQYSGMGIDDILAGL